MRQYGDIGNYYGYAPYTAYNGGSVRSHIHKIPWYISFNEYGSYKLSNPYSHIALVFNAEAECYIVPNNVQPNSLIIIDTSLIASIRWDAFDEFQTKISYCDYMVNQQNSLGETPLFVSVLRQDQRFVELLLKNQSLNPNIPSKIEDTTPLGMAIALGLTKIVALLLEDPRVNLNENFYNGCPVLDLIGRINDREINDLLLDAFNKECSQKFDDNDSFEEVIISGVVNPLSDNVSGE